MVAASLITPAEAVLSRAQEVADRLPIEIDLDWIIGGRASLRGLTSRGRISAGGTCRLLPTLDGWVAINLARPDDLADLPAVLQAEVDLDDPWAAVARHASQGRAGLVAGRFQTFGIAAGVLDDPAVHAAQAVIDHELGAGRPRSSRPRVVDLSSMWAGPLCAHLLGRCGMHVTKVESTTRPDGARVGDPQLFDLLHEGHALRAVAFDDAEGRAELASLIDGADVVIDSSRPRALGRLLGIDAADVVTGAPGRTWVSITGYGRAGDLGLRVAFGDDAAVAGGLVGRDEDGLPTFCADAIADPMAGLFAAAAAFEAIEAGGGRLIEVSMAAVAKALAASD